MRGKAIKLAALTGGCALLVLVFWVGRPNRQKGASPTLPVPASVIAEDVARPSDHPKARGGGTRIEAVWSQYALPGWRVDICRTPDPRSPKPRYERIVDDTVVLTLEGYGDSDGEPTNIITVDLTPEQAERLNRLPKTGWLRAFAKPVQAD
jgi:hypothetical protein